GGKVGDDISGMAKTGSLSGMVSRKMTMLKNANGSSSRGNEIRYMAVALFARGVAGTKSSSGTRVGKGASLRDCFRASGTRGGVERLAQHLYDRRHRER